ncbi:MAG: 23S rRNA (adenine(2503)-C(2))-methyltransferase RlmN [Solirubrobacterales bacterium]|nr:23S rRNA (adenine(2503)-C(2))-methyltransferase RlmN [Solirubrobacterales bacterium]MBV8943599.1 23S rRNA (adenine(2503)-C(2))-methyltransferase RlmN [Solirubrobacterales bacterium]MBV9165322.1 23S rRNA (adenine(2503)-C(2))-methyltransferase RlmN [Solirubrobacterales bacterium]MBV9536365.1 23S rRNA (adenine(2503)-C(2))-methyltransferase RlmN [Solirubrobacterales bacterium]
MDLALLERTLNELREPSYRARQVLGWTLRGAPSFAEMTNLPSRLRAELTARVPFSTLAVQRCSQARDGTIKVLFCTRDGRPVEAVLMRFGDGRQSVCISSQSGCPLTCTFCATGQMRFGRNLTASEIIDQVLHFKRLAGGPDHAVFMGMGEPLLNLDAVLEASQHLPELGIAHRRVAISTVGWVPGIKRLAAEPMPLRLALSLHAAEDPLRSELMPVNERYPVAEVLAACRDYWSRKRRRVFVEYVMLADVNDSYPQAVALASVLDPRIFKVNLIPYNPTASPYRGSSRKAIDAFRGELQRRGLMVTVRVERGREIDAACGQLAAAAPQKTYGAVSGLARSASHSGSSSG